MFEKTQTKFNEYFHVSVLFQFRSTKSRSSVLGFSSDLSRIVEGKHGETSSPDQARRRTYGRLDELAVRFQNLLKPIKQDGPHNPVLDQGPS